MHKATKREVHRAVRREGQREIQRQLAAWEIEALALLEEWEQNELDHREAAEEYLVLLLERLGLDPQSDAPLATVEDDFYRVQLERT